MSEKWRFGVIGCGIIADKHMEAIRNIPQAELAAVSSRRKERAEEVGKREACDWTTDYRELLKRDDIDVVCLTTSSGSHGPIGAEVLAAGKHLLVEKPMAMTVSECERMIEIANETQTRLSVIFQNRFRNGVQQLKRAIDSGHLGRVLYVQAETPNYRTQAYYDSAAWRGTREEDGGALMNQGIHYIDLLLWMGGKVRSVYGKIATQMHDIEVEDIGAAIVTFENGALGQILATTNAKPDLEQTLTVFAENGSVKLSGDQIVHWDVPGLEKPAAEKNPPLIQRQMEAWIEAMEKGQPPQVTGQEGMAPVRLVRAIYESAERNEEIVFS